MYAILLLVESGVLHGYVSHPHTHTRPHVLTPTHTDICVRICTTPCTQAYAQAQTHIAHKQGMKALLQAHAHSGRYNMINGGVSVTLINYNQIKDFIRPNWAQRLVTW